MPFALPALPYAYDALEPYIDEETMRLHHRQAPSDVCHQRQQRAGGHRVGGEAGPKPVLQNLDQIPDEKRNAVRNNAGGHYNHSLFWNGCHRTAAASPTAHCARR